MVWFSRPLAARALAVAGLFALGLLACQGPDEFFRNSAVAGSGGSSASTGGSGSSSEGGSGPGTGGGIAATGGIPGSGGVTATGGTNGTGGVNGGGGRGSGGATGTGGVAGTGGARATGGAGGGATGRAGAGGGAAAGGAGGSGSCTGCKLTIEAYCQSPMSTQTIGIYIDVVNASTTPIPLSSVTVRYWFTLGETTDLPKLDINYAMIGSSVITSKFVAVSPAVMGANEYLEIGFTKTAPTLALFADTGQIQLAFHATGYSSMFDTSQATDYSFQKCPTGQSANMAPFKEAPTITGYINGTLAYGAEPAAM